MLSRFAAVLLAGGALFALALGALVSAVAGEDLVHARAEDLPELEALASRSLVLAADGSVIATLYDENRAPAALEDIPDVLVQAVVAAEDQSFFDHNGVDVRGMTRALFANAGEGEVIQGGSTITQQLVKNEYLTPARTLERKVQELTMAVRLEDELDKREILERYLNSVYFGAGAYGVRAAAERFFGDEVSQLTLAEAALLAGVIAGPDRFDPFERPEEAEARRAQVLDQMVAEGYVDRDAAQEAKAVALPASPAALPDRSEDYFVEEVKRQLLRHPRLGETAQDRFDAVFRGGLRIQTTLDPDMQSAAKEAMTAHLQRSPFTGALVAIDPGTGAVRALVGGPGLDRLRYNLATQGQRQAGSAFKVVTLAAALEAGRSPEDRVDGASPCTLDIGQPEPWNVDNYESSGGGVMTLREATVRSINCAYARAALDVGAGEIAGMAKRLGVRRDLPAVPSLTLGTGEVSPLEMTTVFATLAADGVRRNPYLVAKVEDAEGETLLEAKPEPQKAISPQVARTVTDVLRGVIDRGTGRAAAIGRPAAGKTGTNQEWRDAWFGGYVPQLAAAVWMGSAEGQVSMHLAGRPVTGGSFPAKIWQSFMARAVAPLPVADFAAPDRAEWGEPGVIGELPERTSLPSSRGDEDRATKEDEGDGEDHPGRGNKKRDDDD